MIKKNKILSKTIAVILVVCSITATFASFAGTSVEVYTTEQTVNAGETVSIPIYIDGTQNVLGFKLIFSYDASILTPLSVDNGTQISGGLQDNIEGDATPGNINVYWAGSEAQSFSDDLGAAFFINFAVNELAAGSTTLNIDYSQPDTFDDDFNDVKLSFRDPATITINNSNLDSYLICELLAKTESSIYENEVTLTAGDFFDVTVESVSESLTDDSVLGNISIEFDDNNFEFVSLYSNENQVDSSSVEISDGTIEFNIENQAWDKIRFKCKDTAYRGEYKFNLSFPDNNLDLLKCTPLSLTVNPSSTSEIATLKVPDDIFGKKGQQVVVPITISNNHGLMGYKLYVYYNSEHLEAVSATSTEDFVGNFDNTIGQKNGEFFAIWNTVENNFTNGNLMYITFNVLSDTELESEISLSYSQPDTFNENYEDVIFDCKNNSVYLNCSHSSCNSKVVAPDCENQGYTEYTCEKCGEVYCSDFTPAIGHLFECNGDFSTNDFKYYCKDCNKMTTKTSDDLEVIWNISYVNNTPKRTVVDDSCYLDVVQDECVNAKDYAVIVNSK